MITYIILAQEVVHSMNHYRCREGYMVVKIDLKKAHNSVQWDIQQFVGNDYSMYINNVNVSARGICQDNPMSLHIFVI